MFTEKSPLRELFTLPRIPLTHGWQTPDGPRVTMWFWHSTTHIAYGGEVEGVPQKEDDDSAVIKSQGLRNCDCLELYLCEPSTSRYQEFNIGPQGTWWSGCFSRIRVREKEYRDTPNAESYSELLTHSWRAALRIPISELMITIDPQTLRFNLSAIVGPPQNQSFPSLALIESKEPDFHRPEYFLISSKNGGEAYEKANTSCLKQ